MIEKMFNGPYLRQLDNIVQWSEMDVFQRESVSQHSFKVTVFARVLLEDIFGHIDPDTTTHWQITLFKRECVDYAMFHDFDEALIRRDISHVTKYNRFNGPEIRRNLNALSEHLAQEEFRDGTNSGDFVFEHVIHPATDVKRFVKLCDWLAMAFFIRREQRMGNKNLRLEDTTVFNGVRSAVEDVRKLFSQETWEDAEPRLEFLDTIMNMIYEKGN